MAFVLRHVDLTIDGSDFAAEASQVEFTPTAQAATWTGLADNTVTSTATATWNVTMALGQEWDDPDSLSNYLLENEGEVVDMTFAPRSGGTSFTAEVTISPSGIGGTAGAFAVGSVTLGCTKPVRVPVTPSSDR